MVSPAWMSSAQTDLGHLVEAFADRRTVVLPGYAGSGETTDPGDPLTVDLLAEQIAAAADAASDAGRGGPRIPARRLTRRRAVVRVGFGG